MPESSNHSLFPENERNFGWNQLPHGSISLSPLRRRRTICPSISKRAFVRDSPDFAFFRNISRVFPRVTLTQTTLQITVSGRCSCVCACVCDCECVCCVLCACGKTLKTTRNREKCVWYGVCVVWCCEVRKCENARNNGKIVKTWSSFLARYGHPWTRKRSKIGHFPQRLVFTLPLGFADDFGPKS